MVRTGGHGLGSKARDERAVEEAVRGYLARRMRRYGPGVLLAGGLVAALMLVPTGGGGHGGPAGGGNSGTGAAGSGSRADRVAGGSQAQGGVFSPAAAPGSAGTAVSGVGCGPGVRQVSWSAYAPLCEPAYQGNNGGATSSGVTASTITLTYRLAQSGPAADQQSLQDMQTYVGLFNRQYELYGRHVVLVPFQGQNSARADASRAHDLGSFADVSVYSATEPYGASLAANHVITTGTANMPQSWYAGRSPYAYNANPTSTSFAEYLSNLVCARSNGLQAIFAGDPFLRTKQRVFGLIVPNNSLYSSSADLLQSRLQQCGATVAKRFDYSLDTGTANQQAASAVDQMKSAGVTTVLCVCDPVAAVFDTRAADQQGYHPEWSALWWGDPVGRNYAQDQWAHATASAGTSPSAKASEAYRAFKLANPAGEPAEANFTIPYQYALFVFNALQAAGPGLTPASFERGMFSLPPTPAGLFGPWSYGAGAFTPRTAFGVGWWDPSLVSAYDNQKGGYRDCEGGAYFPAADPTAYGSPHTQLHCFGQ